VLQARPVVPLAVQDLPEQLRAIAAIVRLDDPFGEFIHPATAP
jgi:hypothetical protein